MSKSNRETNMSVHFDDVLNPPAKRERSPIKGIDNPYLEGILTQIALEKGWLRLNPTTGEIEDLLIKKLSNKREESDL